MKIFTGFVFVTMLCILTCLTEALGQDIRTAGQGVRVVRPRGNPVAHAMSKHAVVDPLPAGTYTVGVGGSFATIDSVFDRLHSGGILGPVTLLLTDTLYVAPTTPGDFRLIGPIAGAGPTSRITIRPADNVAVTIRGRGTATLTFQTVSYLTLDGISLEGSTRMNVHTIVNTAYDWNDAIDLWGDCDHNIIQNVTARSERTTDLYTSVLMLLQDDYGAPDSCLVSNVSITSGAVGIYVGAGVYGYSHRPNGNVIRGCHIGSTTDSLISRGIIIDGAEATIVENNHVENLRLELTISGFTSVLGIECYYGNNTIIRNSRIHGLRGSSAANIHAILGYGDATHVGQGLQIYNNMIYDLQNTITAGYGSLAGIALWRNNDILVAFNTVLLSGEGSSPYGTDALNFWEGCTNVTVRNNILVNTCHYQAPAGVDTLQMSAMFVHGSTTFTSDNNDLYVDTSFANNWTVRFWPVGNHRTLSDWQATGQDMHSVSVMPPFVSPMDLHLPNTQTRVADAAIPLPGITVDIDGDPRPTPGHSVPDMGADEFPHPPVGIAGHESVPLAFALDQNFPNPFNPSTTIRYVLPERSHVTLTVFNALGQQVATLVEGEIEAGGHEVKFDASSLASGVYLYQLRAGAFMETRTLMILK